MHEENRPESKLQRLEDWLTNVFWFHYKWYFIAGVFAATLLIVSVVSFISRVDYDWTVIYAHAGEADPAGVRAVEALFAQHGVETSGNQKLQVRVKELCGVGGPGRMDLYGPLQTSDTLLYVLDGPTQALFQSLGYFAEAVSAGGYCAAVNDVPVTPYTLADFAEYNYTQEQIDNSNAYRQDEHDKLAAQARQVLENLKSA